MPLKSGEFTEQEQRFIEVFARTGDKQAAHKLAGYRSPKALMKANDPRILAAVDGLRHEFILKEALPLAMAAHIELLQAPTPAAVRGRMVQLTYDEAKGILGDKAGEKDLAEMTPDEISQRIKALEVIAAAKAVDVTPEDDSSVFE